MSLSRILLYPSAFFSSVVITLYWFALTIVSITILTYQASSVGGWSRYELFLVQGVYSITITIVYFCFDKNIAQFIEEVWNGNFDFKLLKPIDSQFLASFGYFKLHNVARIIGGVLLIAFSLSKLHLLTPVTTILLFSVYILISIVAAYSLWILIASVSFWSPPLFNLSDSIGNFMSLTRYPLVIFRVISEGLVYILLPMVVITTVPAQIILAKPDVTLMILAVVVSFTLFVFSRFVWTFALRHYASASS